MLSPRTYSLGSRAPRGRRYTPSPALKMHSQGLGVGVREKRVLLFASHSNVELLLPSRDTCKPAEVVDLWQKKMRLSTLKDPTLTIQWYTHRPKCKCKEDSEMYR